MPGMDKATILMGEVMTDVVNIGYTTWMGMAKQVRK